MIVIWALLANLAFGADWPDLAIPSTVPAGDGSKDAALVIAIEDYAFAPDLPGAVANGRAWVTWLQQTNKVPSTAIKTLVNAQATKEQILLDAAGIAERVKPGGRLWLVYIGHGAPSENAKDGLLVGVDAQQTALSLQTRGLPQSELLRVVQAGPQADTVAILDACFSGKTAGGDLAPGLAPMVPLYATTAPTATVLTAAGGTEFAGPLSDGRRPAFSYLVLGALRGWGDANGDRVVTASEAVSYAKDALFTTVVGRSQTPQLYGPDLRLGRSGGEAGPDLHTLTGAVAAVPIVARAEDAATHGGDAVDFAAMAAAATAADLGAAVARSERRRRLDAATVEVRAAAAQDYAALEGLVASPTPAGRAVLEAYLARYGSARVTVDGLSEPVAVPHAERVRAALGTVTSPHLGVLRAIPAGRFVMGSRPSEYGRFDDEDAHEVTLTQGFWLMEHEVTQGQWRAVMGTNPSYFEACGVDCPVEQVSWYDAVAFAARVSKIEGSTYRLPTEAEWEYAALGGERFFYAGSWKVKSVAWIDSNSGGTTHPVCQKAPNGYGLCDLSGNVDEWVADWYGPYPTGGVTDPAGASAGSERCHRGGDWNNLQGNAGVSRRVGDDPHAAGWSLGFRLARGDP